MNANLQMTACRSALTVKEVTIVHVTSSSSPIPQTGESVRVRFLFLESMLCNFQIKRNHSLGILLDYRFSSSLKQIELVFAKLCRLTAVNASSVKLE